MSTLTSSSELHAFVSVARRRFESLREAGQETLRVLIDQLGMQMAYLARVDIDERRLRVLVVNSLLEGSPLPQGTWLNLSETFCAGITAPDAPETLTIDDTSSHPVTRVRPMAAELSTARSYLGTRIVLADGSLFGTLAAFDRLPRHFTSEHVDFIEALAHFIASLIDRERTQKRLDAAMTAQRAANADLERVDHVRSDFVKLASHEFRTALAGIQGFSEMIRDEDLSPAEIQEFAADINQDARRLNTMIDQMLNLDRLEAGRIELAIVPTDLNEIIRSVVRHLLQPGSDKRINLRLADSLVVHGDPQRLAEVIVQLVQHALTRTPSAGDVEIVTSVDGNFAHVDVRDHGRGMSMPQLSNVFELTSHIDAETGQFKPSSGLGLAIVRQIVELHGGSAWTKSDGINGAQFHVTIPLAGIPE